MPNLGFENFLYINTGVEDGTGENASAVWTEIDLARDVTVTKDKTEVDGTSRVTARGGYTATEDGLKKLSVEFDTLVPAPGESANAAFDLLEARFETNTNVEVLLVRGGPIDTDSLIAQFMVAGVFGGDDAQPLNDMQAIAFALINKTVPTQGTTLSGDYISP